MKLQRLGVFLSFLFLLGCSAEVRKQLEPRATAFGPLNQLVVVAEGSIWESPIRDTVDYYFSSAYPVLPQPEPIFDLKYFSPEDLLAIKERQQLRAYLILADLRDRNSVGTKLLLKDVGEEKVNEALREKGYKTSIGLDKWADGQILVYMFADGHDKLVQNIKENFAAVIRRIREVDQEKIAAGVYLGGVNGSLKSELRGALGVDLKVPSDYFMALQEGNFAWIRKEAPEVSSNLMMLKVPYRDQQQLTKGGLKILQDSLGRKYVSSEIPDTYMKVNDIDLPMLVETTTLNNYFALEGRGIWEMENDYMGGHFVSYLIHNPNTNELLLLYGFLYAPGEDKREYMQQLEHVMHTIRF